MQTLLYSCLDRLGYESARQLQLNMVERIVRRRDPGVLLLLEHDPVITLGRGGRGDHLLVSRKALEEKGIAFSLTERGGDITYHGPGQIVGYPLLNLVEWHKDVHRYLRALEEVLIGFLKDFGIEAFRVPPHTGVWVGPRNPEKIAAIGVAVKRWVTYHGFALNIDPDLSHFAAIVPCGIRDRGVTSLARLTGRRFPVEERRVMMDQLAVQFGAVFEFEMQKETGLQFQDRLERSEME